MILKQWRAAADERRQMAKAAKDEAAKRKREALASEQEATRLRRERDAERAADRARREKVAAASARRALEAAHRASMGARMAAMRARIAPAGAPVEAMVEAAFLRKEPSTPWNGEAPFNDSFRPTALKLARQFIRPGEQVLVACEVLVSAGSDRDPSKTKNIAVVAFSGGFAVKDGGRTFRTDEPATVYEYAPDHLRTEYEDSAMFTWGERLVVQHSSESPHLLVAALIQAELRDQPQAAPSSGRPAVGRPEPRLIRTARDAELVTVEWMTYLGFTGVQGTPVGPDGGVDVISDEAVAQVKAETVPTGRPKIQQHHGVATAHGKQGLFFSLAGFTSQAKTYAEQNALALFTFDLQGVPEPVNTLALKIWDDAAP